MARGVFERLGQVLEREAPSWGPAPVPADRRRLSGFDLAVLWGDLAIGLLVLLTGALLVPALSFPEALVAIALGTAIGCLLLALVAFVGAREGVPAMVLLRPVLGVRGSYIPTVLNVAQLIGWTGFEFWIMALVADETSTRLFGFSSYWTWLVVVVVVCTALALSGPILVVRRWLERFGAWVVAAVAAWITYRLLLRADLAMVWRRPGTGGLSFWLAVDLVIAMPVSWLPLVADYSRFARARLPAARGTFVGYAIGNAWLYSLGALLVLVAGLSEVTPVAIGDSLAAAAGGWAVLLALLVGETDEAFADIYSAAVSSQNVSARVPQRGAILAIAAAGAALAAWLGVRPEIAFDVYERFLLLLGSVFVPLFGVFVAHYFLAPSPQRNEPENDLRGWAIAAWAFGFLVYQWSVPTGPQAWVEGLEAALRDGLHLPFPLAGSAAGASIPAFCAALLSYAILRLVSRSFSPSPRGALEEAPRREAARADRRTRS